MPSEQLIEWPPSAPMSEAIRPAAQACSISSAVVAHASWSAYVLVSRRAASTCSRVALTASSPVSRVGT